MLLISSKSYIILKENLKRFALGKTWLSSSIPSDLFYIPGSALPKFDFGLILAPVYMEVRDPKQVR